MAKQKPQKWVVLLDKCPRGPFTQDEIQQLIEQGHLRRNDLALLIPPNSQEKSDWKFIWQFPDFDLRQREKEKAPPAAVLEKRTPRSETQIEKEVEENTPLDLRSIQMEDLFVKVQNSPKREFQFENRPEKGASDSPFKDSAFASKTGSGLFVVLALTGMVWVGVQEVKKIRSASNKSVVEEKKDSAASPSANSISREALAPKKRGSESAEFSPPPPPIGDRKVSAEAVPSARDRGEIREEEILRAREEERRRELDEKERRAREEEEERKREDEDGEERPSSRGRKGKRTITEENGDSDSESENSPEPSETTSESSVMMEE